MAASSSSGASAAGTVEEPQAETEKEGAAKDERPRPRSRPRPARPNPRRRSPRRQARRPTAAEGRAAKPEGLSQNRPEGPICDPPRPKPQSRKTRPTRAGRTGVRCRRPISPVRRLRPRSCGRRPQRLLHDAQSAAARSSAPAHRALCRLRHPLPITAGQRRPRAVKQSARPPHAPPAGLAGAADFAIRVCNADFAIRRWHGRNAKIQGPI